MKIAGSHSPSITRSRIRCSASRLPSNTRWRAKKSRRDWPSISKRRANGSLFGRDAHEPVRKPSTRCRSQHACTPRPGRDVTFEKRSELGRSRWHLPGAIADEVKVEARHGIGQLTDDDLAIAA